MPPMPRRQARSPARVVDAGAVGVNVEDGSSTPELTATKIGRIKQAVAKAGVDLWVNARVGVYLRRLKEGDAAYEETITRARRYREAGADSIFVPAVAEEALLARLVRDVGLPLNVLARPGVPPADRLRELGVRRLSAGAGIANAVLNNVHAMAKAFLAGGRSDTFTAGLLDSPEINQLMRRE